MNKMSLRSGCILITLILWPLLAFCDDSGFNYTPVPVTSNTPTQQEAKNNTDTAEKNNKAVGEKMKTLSLKEFSNVATNCPAKTTTAIGSSKIEIDGAKNNICHLLMTREGQEQGQQYVLECYVPITDLITSNLFNSLSEADAQENDSESFDDGITSIMTYCRQLSFGSAFNASKSQYNTNAQ